MYRFALLFLALSTGGALGGCGSEYPAQKEGAKGGKGDCTAVEELKDTCFVFPENTARYACVDRQLASEEPVAVAWTAYDEDYGCRVFGSELYGFDRQDEITEGQFGYRLRYWISRSNAVPADFTIWAAQLSVEDDSLNESDPFNSAAVRSIGFQSNSASPPWIMVGPLLPAGVSLTGFMPTSQQERGQIVFSADHRESLENFLLLLERGLYFELTWQLRSVSAFRRLELRLLINTDGLEVKSANSVE
jgi:hypothetical protein